MEDDMNYKQGYDITEDDMNYKQRYDITEDDMNYKQRYDITEDDMNYKLGYDVMEDDIDFEYDAANDVTFEQGYDVAEDNAIFRAIGNIDVDLVDHAAPRDRTARLTFASWLKTRPLRMAWLLPMAACFVTIAAIAMTTLLKKPSTDNGDKNTTSDVNEGKYNKDGTLYDKDGAQVGYYQDGGSTDSIGLISPAPGDPIIPNPSLSLDDGHDYVACYISLEEWRGRLQTEDYVINDTSDGGMAAERIVPYFLEDLVKHADAFVLIATVNQVAPDGDDMQSAIAEYLVTIGGRLDVQKWDGRTVSTHNRVLIRQWLKAGCMMDQPNNLLRADGIYVLPLRFNEYWGVYEVVGDYDSLFELDNMGRMVSHSNLRELNQYDGMPLVDFIEVIRGLYARHEMAFNSLCDGLLDDGGGNSCISPLSFKLALAMAYNGAVGDTYDLLSGMFGATPSRMNAWARDYMEDAKAYDGSTYDANSPVKPELRIANSYWLREGSEGEISPTFTSTLKADYDAESGTFNTKPDPINNWVSKATGGKIEDILKDVNPAALSYLVNAVYFNASWQNDFDEALTAPGEFTNGDGSKSTVDMLHGGADGYIDTEEFVGITKRLNGNFTFTALMPKTSGRVTLDMLVKARYSDHGYYSPIILTLPKFDFDTGVNFSEGSHAEYDALFVPHGMDGALSEDAVTDGLMISQIIHKTTFTLAEKGIEATAATVISMDGGGMWSDMVEVVFDRPFYFMLTDGDGEVLFYGRVTRL